MFLDAWGSILLFGILALSLSVLVLVGSVFATALGISRMRKGRRVTGVLLVAPSALVGGGVIGLWSYALVDHRPHRTLSVSFSAPATSLPTEHASCRDLAAIGLGKNCTDNGAIYRLQVALPDGTMIDGVSDDIGWTTGKTDRLMAFSFRSVARFTEAEARDLLEREAIRLSDSSRASSRSSMDEMMEWIASCGAPNSKNCFPLYKSVCFRESPMRVCIWIHAPAYGARVFSARYSLEYPRG